MKFSLVTEYPSWFILFCAIAGIIFAALLYYRDKRIIEVKNWLKLLLAFLRFLTVFFLCFLLLSPLLKSEFRELEKPLIVVAQDNSSSIVIGKDSAFYRNAYRQKLNDFIDALSNKYSVKTYSFGQEVSETINYNFDEKLTNFSEFIDEMDIRYANRNLGALLICSDGIYNQGENPVYSKNGIKAPIYTVAIGDTNIKRDFILKKVRHNRIAYLGNNFPLEIYVEAHQLSGKFAQLTISKNNLNLFSKNLSIVSNRFSVNIPLELPAKEKGIQHYKAKITRLDGEATYLNNEQDFFIEVLDGKEKVLLLSAAPHPDVKAIKQAIESNENYEVDVSSADQFNGSIAAYNLVILHQLPAGFNLNTMFLDGIKKSNVSVLYILGAQSSLSSFNSMGAGLNINESNSASNEVQPMLDPDFSLFTLSEETKQFLSNVPPLLAPFGNYKKSNATSVLLRQKIGSVSTDYPLILFSEINGRKTGVIAGEGIWRWRINDFQENNSHKIMDEFVNKIVQYLSVKVDRSLFRVIAKNNYFENESIQLDAEVYNESYELITEPEVKIDILNKENKRFPFSFSKVGNAYQLNAPSFPIGEYTYEAKVTVGQKTILQKGRFSVSPIVLESINTTADHQLLYNLAKKHGGNMFYPNQLDLLKKELIEREDIKSISYIDKKLLDLIHLKSFFFLLLTILSTEWFLRKRNGGY